MRRVGWTEAGIAHTSPSACRSCAAPLTSGAAAALKRPASVAWSASSRPPVHAAMRHVSLSVVTKILLLLPLSARLCIFASACFSTWPSQHRLSVFTGAVFAVPPLHSWASLLWPGLTAQPWPNSSSACQQGPPRVARSDTFILHACTAAWVGGCLHVIRWALVSVFCSPSSSTSQQNGHSVLLALVARSAALITVLGPSFRAALPRFFIVQGWSASSARPAASYALDDISFRARVVAPTSACSSFTALAAPPISPHWCPSPSASILIRAPTSCFTTGFTSPSIFPAAVLR